MCARVGGEAWHCWWGKRMGARLASGEPLCWHCISPMSFSWTSLLLMKFFIVFLHPQDARATVADRRVDPAALAGRHKGRASKEERLARVHEGREGREFGVGGRAQEAEDRRHQQQAEGGPPKPRGCVVRLQCKHAQAECVCCLLRACASAFATDGCPSS